MRVTVDLASGWRRYLPAAVRPYTEAAPIAALFLGISSGAPYALIAATLTTRLAQDGINKRAVTEITLPNMDHDYRIASRQDLNGLGTPATSGKVTGTLKIANPDKFWSTSRFLILIES